MNKNETSAAVLDLHDIKHEDAKQIVISFIESNWDMDKELTIVTGNSIIMKDLVTQILLEYKLPFKSSILYPGRVIAWT